MGFGLWLMEMTRGILNILQHQIVAVLLFFSIWTPIFTYPSALAWHVALCSLGLFPFVFEGLAVLGYDLIYAIELEEKTRGYIHAVMMSLGTIFLAAGAIMEMARDRLTSHFSSTHGILGLICLLFVLFAFIFGFFSRFAKSLKGYARPVIFHFVHNLIGILAVTFGIACMCTGYYLDAFIALEDSTMAATIVACLLLPWALATALHKLYKQFMSMIQ